MTDHQQGTMPAPRTLQIAVLHATAEERGRDVEAEAILRRLDTLLGTGNRTLQALDATIAALRDLIREDM